MGKIIVIVLLILGAFVATESFKEAPQSEVVQLVNQSRKEAGLSPLCESEALNKVARLKAEDMVKNHYFEHTSPAGLSPWHWFDEAGYQYRYAGENLAENFTSVEEQNQAWLDSPTHRENILNKDYTETGVATLENYTVEVFAKPSDFSLCIQ